jgi:hypothetical protein
MEMAKELCYSHTIEYESTIKTSELLMNVLLKHLIDVCGNKLWYPWPCHRKSEVLPLHYSVVISNLCSSLSLCLKHFFFSIYLTRPRTPWSQQSSLSISKSLLSYPAWDTFDKLNQYLQKEKGTFRCSFYSPWVSLKLVK